MCTASFMALLMCGLFAAAPVLASPASASAGFAGCKVSLGAVSRSRCALSVGLTSLPLACLVSFVSYRIRSTTVTQAACRVSWSTNEHRASHRPQLYLRYSSSNLASACSSTRVSRRLCQRAAAPTAHSFSQQ